MGAEPLLVSTHGPVWAGHLPECGPLLRLEKVEKVITEACFRK